MQLSIVAQTEDWIALNKPAGADIHGDQEHLGWVTKVKQFLDLPFLAPVHRLDKVTSGCLLLAKSSEAASHLSKQFEQSVVEKYYLAITLGKPKKKQGCIMGDMEKSRNGSYKLMKSLNSPAITQFFSFGYTEGLRLAIIKILSGKTHQIRVAMKSNGCPILGDQRYGKALDVEAIDRCYLHCYRMIFKNLDDRQVTIQALPEQGVWFKTSEWEHLIRKYDPSSLNWPKKPIKK